MQFTYNAYLPHHTTLQDVRDGKTMLLFSRDGERMEDSGYTRVGTAHIVVRLDDDIDAAIAGAGVGLVEVES